jgi:hypothetical protein
MTTVAAVASPVDFVTYAAYQLKAPLRRKLARHAGQRACVS